MAERYDLDTRRLRPKCRARKTLGEIARVARSEFQRAMALIRVLYNLCSLQRFSAIGDSCSSA